MSDGLAQLLGIVLKCVIRKKSTKSTGTGFEGRGARDASHSPSQATESPALPTGASQDSDEKKGGEN